MTHSPRWVLNALVLRADSSPPEGERRARPGYGVNRAGLGTEDPGVADRTLALTAAPQFEWEAFDAYWRKIHGPKVIHHDGPNDRETALLRYYQQFHRLPGGPCSGAAPPYCVPLTPDGELFANAVAGCPPFARPRYDGLAQVGYASREALERFFAGQKYGAKIQPDEAVFIRGFAFHLAEEYVVLGDAATRRDPIVLARLHVRAPELTREAFRGRWMAQHAALLRGLPESGRWLRRYVQCVTMSRPGDAFHDEAGDRYDGLGLLSFANMNDCEEFLASPGYAALAGDEAEFCAETGFFTTLNYVVLDRTASD